MASIRWGGGMGLFIKEVYEFFHRENDGRDEGRASSPGDTFPQEMGRSLSRKDNEIFRIVVPLGDKRSAASSIKSQLRAELRRIAT